MRRSCASSAGISRSYHNTAPFSLKLTPLRRWNHGSGARAVTAQAQPKRSRRGSTCLRVRGCIAALSRSCAHDFWCLPAPSFTAILDFWHGAGFPIPPNYSLHPLRGSALPVWPVPPASVVARHAEGSQECVQAAPEPFPGGAQCIFANCSDSVWAVAFSAYSKHFTGLRRGSCPAATEAWKSTISVWDSSRGY